MISDRDQILRILIWTWSMSFLGIDEAEEHRNILLFRMGKTNLNPHDIRHHEMFRWACGYLEVEGEELVSAYDSMFFPLGDS